ncbi:Transcription factor GAMYB [Platanthera zijinensis]|uniref:Transcription factor GAMYB n=1 Tax=Platanthera zijinensis TaxID=2320716 RepID=A0AAP0BS53_9ASPA
MDYVAKHGPLDWSSIRSKGLLPRTGKSCRLRWVNKLKPGLKTGCKFSPEEERIVIDLQEIFGHTAYLPGRTDNDVKNFWSTRRKRLARLLQSSLSIRSHCRVAVEPFISGDPFFKFNTNSAALPGISPSLDLIPFTEQSSHSQCLDHHLFDLPPLPEARDLVSEFDDLPLPDQIACPESFHAMRLPEAPAFFNVIVGGHDLKIKHPEMPESFFDDFSSDMFDYLEQPPAGK